MHAISRARPGRTLALGRWTVPATLAATWIVFRALLVAHGGEIGEARELSVAGHRVAALLFRGDVRSRTLVVVVHGGLATKETLVPLCWEVRRRGADCVAVDALGHGGSSALPPRNTLEEVRRALRVDRALGGYDDVRFAGHSMGAYLGCGAVFPCERSVSIGQVVSCAPSRMVFGSVHRTLGLPDVFYLPVSHVLEPWTPSVIDAAADKLLPGTGTRGTGTPAVARDVVLAWTSLAVMIALGLVVARRVRSASMASPTVRAFAAAGIVWTALVVGATRTLWMLVPTQLGDVAIMGAVVAASLGLVSVLRAAGARHPLTGVVGAWIASEIVAITAWALCHTPVVNHLVILLPLLNVPLGAVVGTWERLSRGADHDTLASAAFVAAIHGGFLALLLPAG